MPTLSERSKPGMLKWQAAKKRAEQMQPGQEAQGYHWGTYWTKERFFQEYYKIIDQAINERGGIKFIGRKHDSDQWTHWIRDKHRLEDIKNRIRVYQFESKECQERFSDRLSSYQDN